MASLNAAHYSPGGVVSKAAQARLAAKGTAAGPEGDSAPGKYGSFKPTNADTSRKFGNGPRSVPSRNPLVQN